MSMKKVKENEKSRPGKKKDETFNKAVLK